MIVLSGDAVATTLELGWTYKYQIPALCPDIDLIHLHALVSNIFKVLSWEPDHTVFLSLGTQETESTELIWSI